MNNSTKPHIRAFLAQQRLTDAYMRDAAHHFDALISDILVRTESPRTLIVGIHGSQGSGKSTMAAYLQTVLSVEHGLHTVNLSLDDFYASRRERERRAAAIHPLLTTRGVPGTHEVGLAIDTLNSLITSSGTTLLPQFNKAMDEVTPTEEWPRVNGPVDVVIFEGWCLGATSQADEALLTPINALEQEQDGDGKWRRYVNSQLQTDYPTLFDCVDCWVMLRAPSFDCVYQWRLQQEHKLKQRMQGSAAADREIGCKIMTDREVAEFIQYFQRITEHCLQTLPQLMQHWYLLDRDRYIVDEYHMT